MPLLLAGGAEEGDGSKGDARAGAAPRRRRRGRRGERLDHSSEAGCGSVSGWRLRLGCGRIADGITF